MVQRNYFSHDSVARNDPKILALISEYGLEGYGMFFIICEVFRDQEDYKIQKNLCYLPTLTRELYATRERVEEFVAFCVKIGLLQEDDTAIWSDSFLRRMEKKDEIATKRQAAARERWKPVERNNPILVSEPRAEQKQSKSKAKASDKKEPENVEKSIGKEEKVTLDQPDTIPYKEIGDAYNLICKKLKPIKAITESRKAHIRARTAQLQTLEDWKAYFEKAAESDFLAGDNSRAWTADFDWLISSANNMIKVLENKYGSRKNNGNGNGSKFSGLAQFRVEEN